MRDWHTCETSHCIAGWAEHRFGKIPGLSTSQVGSVYLGIEGSKHFHDSQEQGEAWLRSFLEN
jgi:hypothetical protein